MPHASNGYSLYRTLMTAIQSTKHIAVKACFAHNPSVSKVAAGRHPEKNVGRRWRAYRRGGSASFQPTRNSSLIRSELTAQHMGQEIAAARLGAKRRRSKRSRLSRPASRKLMPMIDRIRHDAVGASASGWNVALFSKVERRPKLG